MSSRIPWQQSDDSTDVDLRALAEEVVNRLPSGHGGQLISIKIHGRGKAQADESKLRLVLTNLIRNAVEASRAGGEVVILIDQPDAATATIEVHDTGQGMTAEVRERVFEPFFTTKAAGSGLGLAISHAIARAHGGDISLVSTTSRGSIFRLAIPSNKEPPP